MIFSIAKKSGSHRELKNIKKISEKASKKCCNSSRNSSSDELDSNSSLYRDSDWDTYIRPAGCKDINKLDHVVTDNINTNKDKLNKAI